MTACREAYTEADEQYACNLGCQNQLPFAERRQEQVSDVTHCFGGCCGTWPLSLHHYLVAPPVGCHDAKDSPAVPSDSGQGAVGGRHEPGPQLDHLLLDVLPPSRRRQSRHFPGRRGGDAVPISDRCVLDTFHSSVFCLTD